MRTVSALDVRKRFGELLDEAAGGERLVIERAGHPIAALVPLSDLDLVDPDRIRDRRRAALREMGRIGRRIHPPTDFDAAEAIRMMRDQRADQIARRTDGE